MDPWWPARPRARRAPRSGPPRRGGRRRRAGARRRARPGRRPVYRSAVRLREVWRHNRPPVARGFVPGAFGICETCNEEVPVYESVTGRYVCGANPEHGLLLADYNGRLLADQARRTPKGGHHGLAH